MLQINQGAVSKVDLGQAPGFAELVQRHQMEKRADMYVSTLRNFIQAMGGQLQVKAIFPEGEVEIDQFENVAEPGKTSTASARICLGKQRQEQKQIPFGNDKGRNDEQSGNRLEDRG